MPIPTARLVSSGLMAALLTWLIAWQPFTWNGPAEQGYLELSIASVESGSLSIRIDEGHGYGPAPETSCGFGRSASPAPLRLKIPPGRIHALDVHMTTASSFLLNGACLRMEDGRVLADLMEGFHPLDRTTVTMTPAGRLLRPAAGASGPAFEFTPRKSTMVPTGDEPWALEILAYFLALTALLTLLQTAAAKRLDPELSDRLRRRAEAIAAACQGRPTLTLIAVALAAAIGSSFPVVFCGKSLVSPHTQAYMLYFASPTLPGAPVEPEENVKGADVGAMPYQNLPYSALESQALFRDGELPLWNRYSSCGVPLLGQGQSMFGDPLHAIPILAGGAWWAWDIKFVLAKALFALGIGFCVRSLTRRLGLAALIGASAAWIGFFAYRFNHPAIFSLCYAPWVLLPWLWAVRADGMRTLAAAGALLIAADGIELVSGAAKEASMLLLCLNGAGFLAVACAATDWKMRARKLGVLVWASVLFFLLSAPHWLLFLDALRHAQTIYQTPHAYQLQPGLLAGFFDEIFTQDFTPLEQHTHPSLNFLILGGVLWLGASWRQWRGDRAVVALAGAAFGVGSLVFGIVPPAWITAIPGLASIYHIHNTFGCVLIVLLLVLAGVGFHHCLEKAASPGWIGTWKRMLLGLGLLLLMYLGFTHAIPQPPSLTAGSFSIDPPWHSRFFVRYVPFLILSAVAAPWALRGMRARGEWRIAALAGLICCLVLLHFRHGMYVSTRFDDYVMNPRTGFDLVAKSMAVDQVKRRLQEPYRTCGINWTLTPGYSALLGLEGITGPDALANPYEYDLCWTAGMSYAWTWRLLVAPESFAQLKPVYDLLNLRFYLSPPAALPLPGLAKIGPADLNVYESKEAWPRAFFTNNLRPYETTEQFALMVMKGDGRPFAAVQGAPPAASPAAYPERQIVPASNYRLTTNTTEYSVKAPGPGVAVLSECFEENNFRVTVNGAPASYFRVNHAFKGVWLDRGGDYRIRFSYWPKFLTAALWLSGLGLVLTLGSVVGLRIIGRRLSVLRHL